MAFLAVELVDAGLFRVGGGVDHAYWLAGLKKCSPGRNIGDAKLRGGVEVEGLLGMVGPADGAVGVDDPFGAKLVWGDGGCRWNVVSGGRWLETVEVFGDEGAGGELFPEFHAGGEPGVDFEEVEVSIRRGDEIDSAESAHAPLGEARPDCCEGDREVMGAGGKGAPVEKGATFLVGMVARGPLEGGSDEFHGGLGDKPGGGDAEAWNLLLRVLTGLQLRAVEKGNARAGTATTGFDQDGDFRGLAGIGDEVGKFHADARRPAGEDVGVAERSEQGSVKAGAGTFGGDDF